MYNFLKSFLSSWSRYRIFFGASAPEFFFEAAPAPEFFLLEKKKWKKGKKKRKKEEKNSKTILPSEYTFYQGKRNQPKVLKKGGGEEIKLLMIKRMNRRMAG